MTAYESRHERFCSPGPKRVVACLLSWPAFCFWLISGRINPYYLDVLTKIGINVILAVSLNLINGYTGQFSLGHAGFMAVGAYTSAAITMFAGPKFLADARRVSAQPGDGLPVRRRAAHRRAGCRCRRIAGWRAVAALKGDYLAIVTLGFGEIIRVIFRNIDSLGGALGSQRHSALHEYFLGLGRGRGLHVMSSSRWSIPLTAAAFIAVRDDEVAAEAMGINTTRYKIVAFVVGAFFAGMAGGLYGHYTLSIDPKGFDFMRSIEIVVMVILGGMGNTAGVIAAAVLLTLLPEFLRQFDQYRMVFYSLLLIILMLTRPQGFSHGNAEIQTGGARMSAAAARIRCCNWTIAPCALAA